VPRYVERGLHAALYCVVESDGLEVAERPIGRQRRAQRALAEAPGESRRLADVPELVTHRARRGADEPRGRALSPQLVTQPAEGLDAPHGEPAGRSVTSHEQAV
jgi:hypothetical protein